MSELVTSESRAIVPISYYKRIYCQLMISLINARLIKLKSMMTVGNLLQIGMVVLSGAPVVNVAEELAPYVHSFITLNKWRRIYEIELTRLR